MLDIEIWTEIDFGLKYAQIWYGFKAIRKIFDGNTCGHAILQKCQLGPALSNAHRSSINECRQFRPQIFLTVFIEHEGGRSPRQGIRQARAKWPSLKK